MSSPNEPGRPHAGESPAGANGSAANNDALGAARPDVPDRGDVPPWQRGPAARAAQPGVRPPEPPRRGPGPGPRGDGPGDDGHPPERPADDVRGNPNNSPGPSARLNRFVSGGSAPTEDVPTRGERTEPPRPETYASELPDLSGPMPRPPQQRKPADRPSGEPASRPASGPRVQVGTRHKGPVRASMQIRRIDPWSTLKVSAVLSVALFFVWMIAVAFLYLVLGGMGVWSKLNSNVGDLLTSAGGGSGGELVSSGTIFGGATLIGLVNIVLLTAMATIGAFVYNLTTDLVGGVEVTLADRD
ncbi:MULTISPECIES: DUF3566 domain-containing protein [unclassified Mycobacterium]|uniref:DUF3566 domain-containing protein n=1 Tax=unclassified Mycobacterium TaxID=2642494 RepID=UPI00073FDED5|nr:MULTISPECIES: DUF3566 domain-containing protein [unclassified Mycobacterium]KUH85642.1 hypothetical protein AU186_23165 [Mycobacterium sp. GA-1999]KUH91500.1 hypothetical protein AU185_10230 [Mycobacterium sp. GA-0227b]KUH96246.1 hypothetical protein AU187_13615 [Mycobacterium sp. IS-1556]